MGGFIGFLHSLLDPNLAFIFFWVGLALIVLELLVPGHVFSGTIGTILLILSVVSFGLLPVQLVGIALLIAAVVLMIVELHAPGFGIWGFAGLVCLVLGGWFLYDRSQGVSVSPAVIATVAVFVGAFFFLVLTKVLKMRHMAPAQGPEVVVGKEGVVIGRGLDPKGIVRVASEEWKATTSDGSSLPAGARVVVTRLDGLALTVDAANDAGRDGRHGAGRRREEHLMDVNIALIGAIVILLLVIVFLAKAIKVVPEYQRLVVFRLGRLLGQKGPGLVLLIPFVDKATVVDLREFYLEIPRQDSITKDNAPIAVDFVMFYKVMDAQTSVVQVGNFAGAALNIASTTLRAVIGDIPLDDMLAKRDEINTLLRLKLDEVTERWGVKVTNVEIREIIPPAAVQEAMTRQMSAERTRRAVVTEADGAKAAAITVAEGNKEAAILNAEGSKQSNILTAEGERQAAILRAEGFALAIRSINESASIADLKTMQLQYLETLKSIGSSSSSKVVVPMELSGLAAGIAAIAEAAAPTGGGSNR